MKKNFDGWLLFFTFCLVSIGIVMVFSASSVTASTSKYFNFDAFYFLKKQLIWAVLGTIGMAYAYKVNLINLRKYSILGIIFSLVLLALVLVPNIGIEVNGAKRWLGLGPFTIQPAEFAKIFFIFYLADLSARRKEKLRDFKGLLPALVILGLLFILIEKEPDLGTSLVLAAAFMGIIFLSGTKFTTIFSITSIGFLIIALSILHESYRLKRMMAFINPWMDPSDTGYHTIQSLIAIGSGGILGLGLGQSRQKFFYLPEQHTDYIFAIIGEELGLIGTVLIVTLFVCLIYRGFKIAISAHHPFLRILGGGLIFMIGFQAFLNLSVVLALLPPTGIPLPFISFGGSSLFSTLIAIGILLNISKQGRCNES